MDAFVRIEAVVGRVLILLSPSEPKLGPLLGKLGETILVC